MGRHILIVEDTRPLADSIRDILEMEGFSVSLVSNGENAITFLQEQMPDLIITDLLMPKMNGFELIENIRSDDKSKDVPIILLTAQIGQENRLAGEKAGASFFIEKPFEEEVLLQSIKTLLRNDE